MEWPCENPSLFPAITPQSNRPARAISKAMPRFFLATALPEAATVDRSKIPLSDRRSRAVRNLRFSYRSGHAVDPHLSPGCTVPNPGSRCSPAGSRQAGLDRTLRDMWESHEFYGVQARCTGDSPVQLARSPLVNAVRQRVAANDSRAECLAGWCVSIRARPAKPRMSS